MDSSITSGLTSQNAEKMIGNKFDMVLVAAKRARDLARGHAPLIKCTNKNIITALREIEEGKIGLDYLLK